MVHANEGLMKRLTSVGTTLEFLEGATSSDELRKVLEDSASHQDVIKLASEQGYEVTRESLAEALKILVDRSLEKDGIPSWIRARIVAPVHD